MPQTHLNFFKFSRTLKVALIAGLFALIQMPQALLAQGIPLRWESKEYQPPTGIGKPGRTEAGGTRGNSCPVASKSLRALVPSSYFGTTVSAYPKLFVYMPPLSPEASPLPVEFVVMDADGNEVYKSMFNTSGMSGILTLELPAHAGLPPLEVGKDYKWSFRVLCANDPNDSSRDIFVEGWVRRVELSSRLENQLSQASRQQQVDLYAEAEIWQDALATLIQLRRDNPTDLGIETQWEKLLVAANLADLTQASPMPIMTAPGDELTSSQP